MNQILSLQRRVLQLVVIAILFLGSVTLAEAASLGISPNTGVYTAGNTFTARVTIVTGGKKVNAAEGTLSFNPRELTVVNVSRTGSIFNLWTEEPSFSNSAGTITFGGGSPTGYSGSGGTVMTVTFKALGAGNPKVTFTSGSVLAADGLGTNILSTMGGATYTVSAAQSVPAPEYVAPANTPSAPEITSTTHPDPAAWYKSDYAVVSWKLPADVTAVRTLFDQNPGTIPTVVYDERIVEKRIDDLPQGASYFHVQFKNADGWGRVAHYRLARDNNVPENLTVTEADGSEASNPVRTLLVSYEDVSPIKVFKVQIDGNEPYDEKNDNEVVDTVVLPELSPGHHTVVIEAIDAAGNSSITSYSFHIEAFEKPVFTEYPTRLSSGVIPVIMGATRPNSTVRARITQIGGMPTEYEVTSDSEGVFTVIPNASFSTGVYELDAVATDHYGAQSERSEIVRMIVEEPGYMQVGSFVVRVLSVIIPLIALCLVLIFGVWYLMHRFGVWKRKVQKETAEAENRLAFEFDEIVGNMDKNVINLRKTRKGKLTKGEEELIQQLEYDITDAREKIRKEIADIQNLLKK